MDTINGKPTTSGEPTMDTGDWRTQLSPDSRQRIVNKIMDTLKRHLPCSGPDGLNELKKIAARFEEKNFTAASSQFDYLRRISLKMLTMESKSQNSMTNTGNNSEPSDPVSQGMQNQVHSQGQSIPIPLHGNQSQARQQLLPLNVQKNMASAAVQSSAGLQSAMPSVCGLTQNPIPNVVGQNFNMQNLSGISQNSLRQGIPSNNFANQQRQMQGSQQVLPQQQQQEQQQQQQQQLVYHQPLQHQLMKQNIQQGNLQPSLMQSNILLQQQQHQLRLLQLQQLHLTQLQSSRQSGMQASSVMHPSATIQSTPLLSLQQNQQSSLQQSTQTMLQKHHQSVLRQQQQPQQSASAGLHKKQTPITQQSMMSQQTGHAIGDDWQEEIYEKTPSIPSTSTLLTPSPTPGNFEKPIYGAKQANDEQAGSGCLVPESVSIGMSAQPLLAESKSGNDTYGNALKTYFGKSNVAEPPHYPRVTMAAKPMSLESFSTSVVTMVDEAAAAVGEDFTSMRKHGLDARNFLTQTGLTGAEKVGFYMAIVALALIFWCIFFIYLRY